VKRDKERWLIEQCEEMEKCCKRNEIRGLYQKIKDIGGKVELKISSVKDKDGNMIEDDDLKKARWKEYFSKLYNVQSPVDRSILDELVAIHEGESAMPDFLVEEVRSAVATLKPRKAPGVDGISAELLQAGGKTMVTALHGLFWKIHKEEQVPDDWGKATITPIFKKGDKSDCKTTEVSVCSVFPVKCSPMYCRQGRINPLGGPVPRCSWGAPSPQKILRFRGPVGKKLHPQMHFRVFWPFGCPYNHIVSFVSCVRNCPIHITCIFNCRRQCRLPYYTIIVLQCVEPGVRVPPREAFFKPSSCE